ncbi:Amino acid ABC transporter membrane protein 1, PAAT family [Hyphomicrobiales bacterium]|nr:Amino acid ABC transporter membrane protein 1, PAAT family [Hyphomicrobiales bacterium]CAH1690862.1 Amino acid ABC transporter membrane protein 1, PAAT family [Hyphomicrobiales bacterium]
MAINDTFNIFQYLALGAASTVYLAIFSIILSGIGGLCLAALLLQKFRIPRYCALTYSFTIRGIPLLVLLVGFYYSFPYLGFDFPPRVAAVIVISAYFSAHMAEVFRAAINAIPRGQWDAGRSVGMRNATLLRIIILPLAMRLVAAPFVNVSLSILKGTSLVVAIGVWELASAGRELEQRTGAALEIYLAVAAMYFVLCFALSLVSRRIEKAFQYVH